MLTLEEEPSVCVCESHTVFTVVGIHYDDMFFDSWRDV